MDLIRDSVILLGCAVPIIWMIKKNRRRQEKYKSLTLSVFSAGSKLPRHISANPFVDVHINERKDFFSRAFQSSGLIRCNTKVIHVAGTKGKGSTCEYIAACLRSNGYKVGVFTSPHLHTVRERVKIGTELIGMEDFTRLCGRAFAEMGNLKWANFFDILLYTALLFFGENRVNYVILEAGMGGRYDSTNFLESPTICVITNIGLDHQMFLGDTIELIAAQKAGIIKKQTPVFTTASQEPSVLEVFREEAKLKNATLHCIPVSNSELQLNLKYDVQMENLSLAIAVLNYLCVPLVGLSSFYWPCRMEQFRVCGQSIIVDGNHNGESTRRFLLGVKKLYPSHLLITIFGSGSDKCLDAMADQVSELSDIIIPVQSRHFKSSSVDKLMDVFQSKNIKNEKLANDLTVPQDISLKSGNIAESLVYVFSKLRFNQAPSVIVTCGSLFVASEAREFIYSLNPDAFKDDDWIRESDFF